MTLKSLGSLRRKDNSLLRILKRRDGRQLGILSCVGILILMSACVNGGLGGGLNPDEKPIVWLDFCVAYEPIHDVTSPTVRRNNATWICECNSVEKTPDIGKLQTILCFLQRH